MQTVVCNFGSSRETRLFTGLTRVHIVLVLCSSLASIIDSLYDLLLRSRYFVVQRSPPHITIGTVTNFDVVVYFGGYLPVSTVTIRMHSASVTYRIQRFIHSIIMIIAAMFVIQWIIEPLNHRFHHKIPKIRRSVRLLQVNVWTRRLVHMETSSK